MTSPGFLLMPLCISFQVVYPWNDFITLFNIMSICMNMKRGGPFCKQQKHFIHCAYNIIQYKCIVMTFILLLYNFMAINKSVSMVTLAVLAGHSPKGLNMKWDSMRESRHLPLLKSAIVFIKPALLV